MRALGLLQALDFKNFISFFWYVVILELPRYLVGAFIIPIAALRREAKRSLKSHLTVSVIVAGNNEAPSLRACIESLNEQTVIRRLGGIEIIVVDDGSSDRMIEIAHSLQHEGKISMLLRCETRSSKSSALNLGLSVSTGEIVFIIDADTSLDRDALEKMLAYFNDPQVGAVSGNLGVRNASSNLLSRYQAIEYAIGISLGRCISDALGTLSIVSGAFGAFRLAAIRQIGGMDISQGEDADLTMKLRREGWRIRFAPEAHALTIVPENTLRFIVQRLRWDRSIVAVWMRKYRSVLNARETQFRLIDAAAFFDVIGFGVLLPFLFVAYVIWLFYNMGEFAMVILGATIIVLSIMDAFSFLAAATVGVQTPLNLFLYLPAFTITQLTLGRAIRLTAIMQEIIFRTSYRDPNIPKRIIRQADVI